MLCGISTSFPVLSPCIRQVTHALLTRPPLRYLLLNISARLACVRHAASVRPEPGSNSQINLLFESLLALNYVLLTLLLVKFASFSFKLTSSYFITLFTFQSPSLLHFKQLLYTITFFFRCQHFFCDNFQLFLYRCSHQRQLLYYTTLNIQVQL